ncbi:MAG TPA: isopentenyl phosphate kinase [Roseiflexaceae bacterium]|nr:isopentenyl phosphate kinase [Roseiflexaceae bacterium]
MMLTFVKLGGSVITDKTGQEAPDLATIRRLAGELRDSLMADPGLRLILGHGSGSFGHTYAARYGIHRGIAPGADWMGFALTAAAALRLNRIVVDELLAAGVPALALQPSATLRSAAGELVAWDTATTGRALERGLVPIVHGDVAFDDAQGTAIISTEQLLLYLAHTPGLRPARIILVGEAGVYTADPRANPQAQLIPHIAHDNIAAVLRGAGGSHGADVTGGMRGKVELLWRLIEAQPDLTAQLIGPAPGLLRRALLGQARGEGTTIAAV